MTVFEILTIASPIIVLALFTIFIMFEIVYLSKVHRKLNKNNHVKNSKELNRRIFKTVSYIITQLALLVVLYYMLNYIGDDVTFYASDEFMIMLFFIGVLPISLFLTLMIFHRAADIFNKSKVANDIDRFSLGRKTNGT